MRLVEKLGGRMAAETQVIDHNGAASWNRARAGGFVGRCAGKRPPARNRLPGGGFRLGDASKPIGIASGECRRPTPYGALLR